MKGEMNMTNPLPKIIVVEDHAGVRKTIERILRTGGFAVVLFESAEAVLQTNAAESADCLVFDVNLPGISGFELYLRLVKSGKTTPVVFITAGDEPALRQQAEQLGGDRQLSSQAVCR
jgi:FixJ family two-component response regulator